MISFYSFWDELILIYILYEKKDTGIKNLCFFIPFKINPMKNV